MTSVPKHTFDGIFVVFGSTYAVLGGAVLYGTDHQFLPAVFLAGFFFPGFVAFAARELFGDWRGRLFDAMEDLFESWSNKLGVAVFIGSAMGLRMLVDYGSDAAPNLTGSGLLGLAVGFAVVSSGRILRSAIRGDVS